MKFIRRFPNAAEALVFAQGLEEANNGNIHSVSVTFSAEAFKFPHVVTWHNEDRKPSELPKKHLPLTPAEYAQCNGAICPVCRGRDMTGDSVDIDGRQAFQQVTCNNPDCEASWTDCYELSGYDNLDR